VFNKKYTFLVSELKRWSTKWNILLRASLRWHYPDQVTGIISALLFAKHPVHFLIAKLVEFAIRFINHHEVFKVCFNYIHI